MKQKLNKILPGGSIKSSILLFILLVLPFCTYNYISKGNNNFVKLAVIGGDNHKIPSYSFINQNNDTITNEDNKEINTIVVRYNEGLLLDTFSTININHIIIAGYKCKNNVCEYSLNIPYL